MEINLTLVGQLITFAIVVWFTMRYVWPPLAKALHDRQKHIADALAQAEETAKDREKANLEVQTLLQNAKAEASGIIEQAHKRAQGLIDQAKEDARIEGQRLIESAKTEITREVHAAKRSLQEQVAKLAVLGAEKILKREVNQAANQALIDDIINTEL